MHIDVGDCFYEVVAFVRNDKNLSVYADLRMWITTNKRKIKYQDCVGYYLTCCIDGVTGTYDKHGEFIFNPRVSAKYKKRIKSSSPDLDGLSASSIAAYEKFIKDYNDEIAINKECIDHSTKTKDIEYWHKDIKDCETLIRSATLKLNKLKKLYKEIKNKRKTK